MVGMVVVFLPGGDAVAMLIDVGTIGSHFESLPDPRHHRNRKHRLADVLVICTAAVLCGCDGPTAIHRWAANRRDWLRQSLALPGGIPSRDCLRRVLIAVKPEAFQACFRAWVAAAIAVPSDTSVSPGDTPTPRHIAIDGKTCAGSHDRTKDWPALHIVSAWASDEGLALGQVATDAKSNEITAIPQLLDQIVVKDAVVTIDAMGCQKAIVAPIVKAGGIAVIAVKKNQPTLHGAIEAYFAEQLRTSFEELSYRQHETHDEGHGRTDDRVYWLAKVPPHFAPAKDWPHIKAIGYAARYTRHPDGTDEFEVRYFLLTRHLGGKRFAEAVRQHWSIEAMHWTLDVTFREDDHRTRERTMANNLSWLRRFAVSLLKRHPENDSLKGKMLRCAYNTDFLSEVLRFQQN
jgi:predicted transposase YbfD/YdcC